jgi:5-dehydro-2-deoxygluconokinase
MNRRQVYCLGRVIVDLYADQLHTPLSEVTSFSKYLGGSAGNTAYGLARLGADAGLISRVGADEFGTFLLNQLAAAGVGTEMVRVDPTNPTGLAFAAIFPPADSRVHFYRKPCADNHLAIRDIDESRLGGMLVLAATALAESPAREAALYALEVNRARGGLNVIDVDWRPRLWADEQEARLYYRLALSMADTVLANESELAFAGESADPETAASRVLAQGPARVVAKRGAAGVWLFGEGDCLTVPPFQVTVMNTLGAGDGFGAAYCYATLQGWPAERSLTFAAAAGAIVVSRHSCSAAMPTRAEIEALMASQGRAY